MALETELKLRITPEQMARLKRHALLKSHQQGRALQRQLYNIYFDTPKHYLHRHAMALRLRRSGSQWLQTLKGGGGMQAGLHQRNEWEVPVAIDALDFTATAEAAWQAHLPQRVRDKLHPVFVTDFARSVYQLEWQGAHVELCIDHGEIRTDKQALPLCEVELELKSGEPRQLFELALVLLDVVPFALETVSKAEYGYRLLAGHVERPSKAKVPQLSRRAALADALKVWLWSCITHLQANARGRSDATGEEFLHQMRVALRRLRVALSMAKRLHTDETLVALDKQAGVLAGMIGNVRDWDVFIGNVAQAVAGGYPEHLGIKKLLTASGEMRRQQHDVLFSAEGNRTLQHFILSFAVWMNSDYWDALRAQTITVRKFAKRHERHLMQSFQNKEELGGDDAATLLHALRILSKKLRYSTEFFAACDADESRAVYLRDLGKIQARLGDLHDLSVARQLLESLPKKDAALVDAIALTQDWVAHEENKRGKALRKSLKRLSV